jgi:hypothetical protein
MTFSGPQAPLANTLPPLSERLCSQCDHSITFYEEHFEQLNDTDSRHWAKHSQERLERLEDEVEQLKLLVKELQVENHPLT